MRSMRGDWYQRPGAPILAPKTPYEPASPQTRTLMVIVGRWLKRFAISVGYVAFLLNAKHMLRP
jgi:hypothetical protein